MYILIGRNYKRQGDATKRRQYSAGTMGRLAMAPPIKKVIMLRDMRVQVYCLIRCPVVELRVVDSGSAEGIEFALSVSLNN